MEFENNKAVHELISAVNNELQLKEKEDIFLFGYYSGRYSTKRDPLDNMDYIKFLTKILNEYIELKNYQIIKTREETINFFNNEFGKKDSLIQSSLIKSKEDILKKTTVFDKILNSSQPIKEKSRPLPFLNYYSNERMDKYIDQKEYKDISYQDQNKQFDNITELREIDNSPISKQNGNNILFQSNYNTLKNSFNNQEISGNILNGQCLICDEDFNYLDSNNGFLDCSCIIHSVCFDQYLENQIKSNILPINCPNGGCQKEINPAIILKAIKDNKDIFIKYEKFTMNHYKKSKDDIYSCPTADCDYIFIMGNDFDKLKFNCPKCLKSSCLTCNSESHAGITCEESKKNASAEKAFYNMVEANKYKQCPKCKYWVEKNQGCNHMICLCKNEFCYICGKNYVNKAPNCQCYKNNCQIF